MSLLGTRKPCAPKFSRFSDKMNDDNEVCILVMDKINHLLTLGALLFVFGMGYDSANIPGDFKEPRCKARRSSDPGRLNIDSSAKSYGMARPCEAFLIFYIAQNTDMRSFLGKVTVFRQEGNKLFEHPLYVEFKNPSFGMFRQEISLKAVEGQSCRILKLSLSSLECRDKQGGYIDCPKIRLKTSMVFQDILIDDKKLHVCFDD